MVHIPCFANVVTHIVGLASPVIDGIKQRNLTADGNYPDDRGTGDQPERRNRADRAISQSVPPFMKYSAATRSR